LPFVVSNPDLAVHAFLQRSAQPTARGKEASSAKDDFPDAKVYHTVGEFFGDKDIDLVVVATGHDSHAYLAIAALEAGKHGEHNDALTRDS
jgi:predicted dehydrogenase